MAHNIATNLANGQKMVYTAGSLPWHNLGQNVQEAQTWEQAIKLANLDWKLVEAKVYTNWQKAGLIEIPGMKAVVRADTKQTLGVHGTGYQIFQNAQMFEFCDALLEEGARYESAGGLGIGERIWCLARIPQADFEIGTSGDKHEMYLLGASSHDGSLSTTFMVTDTRVVCQNTLTAALGAQNKSADGKLKIKHTKSADIKLAQAQRMIAGTIQTAESLKVKLQWLANVKLTKESYTAIVDKLFPVTDPQAKQTRRENMLAEILGLYDANDGNMFPEQRGTAYALLNAITDYTDHARGTRTADENKSAESARSESALFGSGAKLKSTALDTIFELTGSSNDALEALVR